VGVEVHLVAAAAHSLRFGRDEEARAETVPTEILADPDRLHKSGSTPGPAVQTRRDRPVGLAHEDRQRATVVDTARGRVELVEPRVEQRDVLSARIVLDPEVFVRHPGRYPAWTASASSSSARMVSDVGTPVAGSQPCST